MSDQFVGEVRWFPYARGVPTGWQACDGSLLSVSEYEVLYLVLGTVYGGDGVNTFGVPDLRGQLPVHQGQGVGLSARFLGMAYGSEGVTLTAAQLGGHSHVLEASSAAATSTSANDTVPATLGSSDTLYISAVAGGATASPINAAAVGLSGGNQAHENRAPTLAIVPGIAFVGVFPQQA